MMRNGVLLLPIYLIITLFYVIKILNSFFKRCYRKNIIHNILYLSIKYILHAYIFENDILDISNRMNKKDSMYGKKSNNNLKRV